MRVGLFIPCYVDQFYPRVAISTLELLEKVGCDVFYPLGQTCCGQPLANAGYASSTDPIALHFIDQFETCEYVVAPSGSCVLHVREHFPSEHRADSEQAIPSRIFELCEFLTDVVGLDHLDSSFPHRVGLHSSCHGLRGLRLGRSSERMEAPFDKVRDLLNRVQGLELVELNRTDECCGFGGTFAVKEEIVSVAMGRDRIRDHVSSNAEFITGTDMSCLMHLEGIIRRDGLPIRVKHVAEILNGHAP